MLTKKFKLPTSQPNGTNTLHPTRRYPFIAISGEGLGYLQSSYTQIGEVLPSRGIGQANIQLYANITNGNLVVETPPALAVERNGTLKLNYVYNSQAQQNFWRLGFKSLTNIPTPGKDAITLIGEDGHQSQYKYDDVSKIYLGPQGFNHTWPVISYDSNAEFGCWRWHDPSTRHSEFFDANGRLVACFDERCRRSIFSYGTDEHGVTTIQIQGESGTRYLISQYPPQGNSYVVIFYQNEPSGTKTILQQHQFNVNTNCLVQTTLGDGISEPKYTIIYRHDAAPGETILNAIFQTDGTQCYFGIHGNSTSPKIMDAIDLVAGNDAEKFALFSLEDKTRFKLMIEQFAKETILHPLCLGFNKSRQRYFVFYVDQSTPSKYRVQPIEPESELYQKLQQLNLEDLTLAEQLVLHTELKQRLGVAAPVDSNRFEYQTQQTLFTAGGVQKTYFIFDSGKHLVALKQQKIIPGKSADWDVTHYRFNTTTESLATITYPDQSTDSYQYAFQGQLTLHQGANGQKTLNIYDGTTGAKLLTLQAYQPVGAESPLLLTTYFVYDNNFLNGGKVYTLLRFKIAPNGGVTEYVYNTNADIVAKNTYALAFPIPTQTSNAPAPISLADMQAWLQQQNPKVAGLIEFACNERGQIFTQKDYASIDNQNHGVDDAGMGYQEFSWMSFGKKQHEFIRIDKAIQQKSYYDYTTFYRLKRQRELQDNTSRITEILHDDANNQTLTTLPNGRQEIKQWDVTGQNSNLISKVTVNGKTDVRNNSFIRDTVGRIAAVTRSDGQLEYLFYENQDRLIFKVEPVEITQDNIYLMTVTEYRYDRNNNTQMMLRYNAPVDKAKFVLNPGILPAAPILRKLLNESDPKNRVTYQCVDASQRLRFQVDSGIDSNHQALIEYRYDELNRKTDVINYSDFLTADELALLLQGKLNRTPDSNKDRWVRYAYDDNDIDGHIKYAQDAAGYMTYFECDVLNRVTTKISYATKMGHDQPLYESIPPASMKDATHYYYWDGKNQCIAEIDAENNMSEISFSAAGKVKTKIRYANAIKADPTKTRDVNQLRPDHSLTQDKTVTYLYDELNREISRVTSSNATNFTTYDLMDNITGLTQEDNQLNSFTDADQYRRNLKRFDAWEQCAAECPPLVTQCLAEIDADSTIPPNEKDAEKEKIWNNQSLRSTFDPVTGLKRYDVNPLNQKTTYYYDTGRRLRFSINAEGTIKETIYNYFDNEKIILRIYATQFSADEMQSLAGGFLTPALLKQFAETFQKSQDKNEVITLTRDNRGDVIETLDAKSNLSKKTYNAFQEVIQEQLPVATKTPTLIIDHQFEQRGLETQTTKTAENASISVEYQYENQFGKETQFSDEREAIHSTEYNRVGAAVTKRDPENKIHSFKRNAFQRIATETNSQAGIIQHDYNEGTRTHTLTKRDSNTTDPVIEQTTITQNIFSETVQVSDALTNTLHLKHAPHGQICEHENALHYKTTDFFDLIGQCLKQVDGNQIATTFRYNNAGFKNLAILDPTTPDHPGLDIISLFVPDAFNNNESMVDANNNTFIQTFDLNNKLTQQIILKNNDTEYNVIQQQVFNAKDTVIETNYGDVNNFNARKITKQQDGFNRNIGIILDPDNKAYTFSKIVNAAGDVRSEKNNKGQIVWNFYNSVGKKIFSVDAKGFVIAWNYDSEYREISEYGYQIQIDASKIDVETTIDELKKLLLISPHDQQQWKFYNPSGQLRFSVKATGAITEHVFDRANREIETIHYAINIDPQNLTKVSTADLITFTQKNADAKSDQHQYTVYDANNQPRFIIDALGAITEQCFDANELMITKIIYSIPTANPENLAKQPVDKIREQLNKDSENDQATFTIYDNAKRPLFKIDGLGQVTGSKYDKNNNEIEHGVYAKKIIIPLDYDYDSIVNAVIRYQPDPQKDCIKNLNYDNDNHKIKTTEKSFDAKGVIQTRETSHIRDNLGREIKTIQADGQCHYQFFDIKDRIIMEVNPNGRVTAYNYDDKVNIKTTLIYANTIDIEQLNKISGRVPTIKDVESQLQPDTKNDRESIAAFDAMDQLIYAVDADNYVVEHRYNAFKQETTKIEYKDPLTKAQLALLKQNQLTLTPDVNQDRCTQTFYNSIGKKLYQQDAAGYITQFHYDNFDNVTDQMTYLKKIPVTLWDQTKTTIEPSLPEKTTNQDIQHFYYWDKNNQLIAEIDGELHLKELTRDAFRRVTETYSYSEKLNADPNQTRDLKQLRPDLNLAQDQVSSTHYDQINRSTQTKAINALVTQQYYDQLRHPIDIEKIDGLKINPDKTDGDRYRAWLKRCDGFGNVTAECPPIVSQLLAKIDIDPTIPPSDKEKEKEKVWANNSIRHGYDDSGLKLHTLDSLNRTTYYFYNAARKLVVTVATGGLITEITRNSFDEEIATRKYNNRAPLNKITEGGFITPEIVALFVKDDDKDHLTTFTRDQRGLITQTIDPDNYIFEKEYNAFQEIVTAHLPIAGKNPTLTLKREFDVRGANIKIDKITATKIISESYEYNHPLGRKTQWIDSLQNSHSFVYDRRGDLTQENHPLGKSINIVIDAFHRPLQSKNSLNEVTKLSYPNENRSHIISQLDSQGMVIKQYSQCMNTFSEKVSETQGLDESLHYSEYYTHTPQGDVTIHTDALMNVTTDTYTLTNQKQTHSDANKIENNFTYTEEGFLQEMMFDPSGLARKTKYVPNSFGLNELIIDPKQIECKQIFDKRDRVTQKITDPNNNHNLAANPLALTEKFDYNANNKIVYSQKGDATQTNQWDCTKNFDDFGRTIGDIIDPKGLALATTKELDDNGNTLVEFDTENHGIRYVYDAANNQRFIIKPTGFVIETYFNSENRKIWQRGYQTKIDPSQFDNNSTVADVEKVMQGKQNTEDNLQSYFCNDIGQLRFSVNSFGAVAEALYDLLTRDIGTLEYYDKVDPDKLDKLTTAELAALLNPNDSKNRSNFSILDGGNQPRFKINGRGTITERHFDNNGNEIASITYFTRINDALSCLKFTPEQFAEKISNLKNSQEDRAIFTVYSHSNKPIYIIDGKGKVTQYVYDANDNCETVCIYSQIIKVPEKYADLIKLLENLQPDKTIDRIFKYEFDNANRKIAITDPLGYRESYEINALNQETAHIDKLQQRWEKDFDRSQRLIEERTPPNYVTFVTQTAGKLSATTQTIAMRTHHIYAKPIDKPTAIISAFDSPEAAPVYFNYDETQQITEIRQENIGIDDKIQKQNLLSRPETMTTLTVTVLRNAAGKVLVEKNAAGAYIFTVYNAEYQKIYQVNPAGSLVEWQYETFGEPVQEIAYATPLTFDFNQYIETGIPRNVIEQNKKVSAADRSLAMEYDNSGNLTAITKSEIFYYLPNLTNTPDYGLAHPRTQMQYNSFDETICVAKLVDPKRQIWGEESTWYNQTGKIDAKSNPNYRIHRFSRNAFGEEILRTEYANCLKQRPDPELSVDNIDKAIVPNPNEDRIYSKEYDVRGNQSSETLKNVVAQALTSNGGIFSFYDLPAEDIETTFGYDVLSRKNKIVYPNGGIVYRYYDVRNNILAETGIPRSSEDEANNPVVKVPLTFFGYSSHGYRVLQAQYKYGTDPKKLGTFPTPLQPDGDDQLILTQYDFQRGLKLAEQDAEGIVFNSSYTDTGKISREWQPLTNWNYTQPVMHIDETDYYYTTADNPNVSVVKRDGTGIFQTVNSINAFGENVGEGADGIAWPIGRVFDNTGFAWLSNEEKEIPTISLTDLAGRVTVRLRSAPHNLMTVNYQQLPTLLSTWSIDELERTETIYDLAGKVLHQSYPAYLEQITTPQQQNVLVVLSQEFNKYAAVYGKNLLNRYGFISANGKMTTTSFQQQLTKLIEFNKCSHAPALFISQAPQEEVMIAGVYFNNQLLIIDPRGVDYPLALPKAWMKTIGLMQQLGIVNQVWLSNQILQLDAKNLQTPAILLSILDYWQQLSLQALSHFMAHTLKALRSPFFQEGLRYYLADTTQLLPPELLQLWSVSKRLDNKNSSLVFVPKISSVQDYQVTVPWHHYQWDNWNNKIWEQNARGFVTERIFNKKNKLRYEYLPETTAVSEQGQSYRIKPTTVYGYNTMMALISVSNANNNTTAYGVDEAGQPRVTYSGAGVRLEYAIFDALQRKERTINSQNFIWRNQFNHRNQLILESSPAGRSRQFAWNEIGKRSVDIDGLNKRIRYSYNVLGDVSETYSQNGIVNAVLTDRNHLSIAESNASGAVRWNRSYNGIELSYIDYSGAQYSSSHDCKQQLTRRWSTGGGHGQYLGPLPLDPNNRNLLAVPGEDISYTWQAGRQVSINDVSYNQLTRFGYLANGRRNQVTVTAGSMLLQNIVDNYDENDRSFTVTDRNATIQIRYDNLGNYRVVSATVNGATTSAWNTYNRDEKTLKFKGILVNGNISTQCVGGLEISYNADGFRAVQQNWNMRTNGYDTQYFYYDVEGLLYRGQNPNYGESWELSFDFAYRYINGYSVINQTNPESTFFEEVTEKITYNDDDIIIAQTQSMHSEIHFENGDDWTQDITSQTNFGNMDAFGEPHQQLTLVDAAGQVENYHYTDELTTTFIGFDNFEIYKVSGTRTNRMDPNNPVTGPVTNVEKYYTPNGAGQYIHYDDQDFQNSKKVLITNADGEVIDEYFWVFDQLRQRPFYYNAEGRVLASGGGVIPKILLLNANYQMDTNPFLPRYYLVLSGDTFIKIAQKFGQDETFAQQLAKANGYMDPTMSPPMHTRITLPLVDNEHNNSQTFLPYADLLNEIVGVLYPHLKMPKPKQPHQSFWHELVEAAVGTILMVLVPEFASFIVTLLQISSLASAEIISFGVMGALSNATEQGVAIGFGDQDRFHLSAVLRGAIESAVAEGTNVNVIMGNVIKQMIEVGGTLMTMQLGEIGLGLRKQLNIRDLIVSTIAMTAEGSYNTALQQSMNNVFISGLIKAGFDTVLTDAIERENFSLGQLAANYIGDLGAYEETQEQQALFVQVTVSSKNSRANQNQFLSSPQSIDFRNAPTPEDAFYQAASLEEAFANGGDSSSRSLSVGISNGASHDSIPKFRKVANDLIPSIPSFNTNQAMSFPALSEGSRDYIAPIPEFENLVSHQDYIEPISYGITSSRNLFTGSKNIPSIPKFSNAANDNDYIQPIHNAIANVPNIDPNDLQSYIYPISETLNPGRNWAGFFGSNVVKQTSLSVFDRLSENAKELYPEYSKAYQDLWDNTQNVYQDLRAIEKDSAYGMTLNQAMEYNSQKALAMANINATTKAGFFAATYKALGYSNWAAFGAELGIGYYKIYEAKPEQKFETGLEVGGAIGGGYVGRKLGVAAGMELVAAGVVLELIPGPGTVAGTVLLAAGAIAGGAAGGLTGAYVGENWVKEHYNTSQENNANVINQWW